MLTREEWLLAAAAEIVSLVPAAVQPFRVSVGWPRGARGKGSHAIGQCWHAACSADKTREIFISPELQDAARVLDVLAHELLHAALPPEAKHGAAFRKLALHIGLEGRMTATTAGPAFAAFTQRTLAELPPYPHAALSAAVGGGKQTTRMLKVQCAACGMVARTTRLWLETTGAPLCACNTQPMELR